VVNIKIEPRSAVNRSAAANHRTPVTHPRLFAQRNIALPSRPPRRNRRPNGSLRQLEPRRVVNI
jgi:preprotein translocase subunit Sec61beta